MVFYFLLISFSLEGASKWSWSNLRIINRPSPSDGDVICEPPQPVPTPIPIRSTPPAEEEKRYRLEKKVEVSNFFLFFFYFSFYNGSRSIGTYAKIYSKTFPPILRLFFLLLFSFLVYFSQHSRGWNQPTVTQRSSEAGDCGISLRFSIATNQHSSDQMRGKRWKCKTMKMKCFRIVIYLVLSSFVKRVSQGLGTVKELCFRVR